MSKELWDWTWLQRYQIPTPILFIDEANKQREIHNAAILDYQLFEKSICDLT